MADKFESGSEPAVAKLDEGVRLALAKQFIESVIFGQYRQLVSWRTVTGQSSQLDSGHLAQQLLSLLTGVPGSGQRGKGVDLADGAEVKAASTVSGRDIPRWNNKLDDERRVENYLALPAIYFVLFDTLIRGRSFPLRVRVWKVQPPQDACFQAVVREWAVGKSRSNNFQLHPPCWRDNNIATNQAGNLELPLMFRAQQIEIGEIDYMEVLHYETEPGFCRPPDEVPPPGKLETE